MTDNIPSTIYLIPGSARFYDGSIQNDDRIKYIRADLVPEWKPIETAPTDGTVVLVVHPVLIRSDKKAIVREAWMKDGLWAAHPSLWLVKESQPTHWMPLPKPPEGDK